MPDSHGQQGQMEGLGPRAHTDRVNVTQVGSERVLESLELLAENEPTRFEHAVDPGADLSSALVPLPPKVAEGNVHGRPRRSHQ